MKKDDSKFTNKEIAELLRSIAAAYLLQNAIRFKVIAYENAADTVEHLTRELRDIWQDGSLGSIQGLGPNIRSHLEEYFQKGSSKHFDSVLKNIPDTVFELMKIPSIGPKKAYKLVNALKLYNKKTVVDDLRKQAACGHIEKIPTFGAKSQSEILAAIDLFQKEKKEVERMPLPYAHALATEIMDYLKELPVIRVDALGSLRRMVSTIGDIDIAVCVEESKSQNVLEHFLAYPKKIKVDNAGDKKASIIIPPNIRVDLRVQDKKSYGAMLQYFTGSKAHNIKLREYAIRKGLSLSEWGIKKIKQSSSKSQDAKQDIITFDSEEKFYEYLGLQYIPPEIREGTNEIEVAKNHKVPPLVSVADIKGDLHLHSSYDLETSHDIGENSYEQIVRFAENLNYEYVGFADHNPKQSGLSKAEVVTIMKKRKQNIGKLFSSNKSKRCNYFISLETDILPDGNIALPLEAVEYVDFLIVSVHSSFRLPRAEMTKRVVKALSFPKVKVLGHPTGRLLNKRPSIDLDWDIIFNTVKKNNQALEINSWPERLDLPDILVRGAIENGVHCIINTDAHANYQMNNMKYGVSVARRGWATKNDIINTLSYQQFKKWIFSLSS